MIELNGFESTVPKFNKKIIDLAISTKAFNGTSF